MVIKLYLLQDGKHGILTNAQNQNAKIEKIFTDRIEQEFIKKNIVVVTGFQGIDKNENITTLGRGGSDTTAVALAAALKAKHCYIFSDVDGIYSTDPNKIQIAKKIEEISYDEMFEIADEGARVLHNRCIEIGARHNIPIIAKSTFNNESGSIIQNKIEDSGVKSIVKNDDLIYAKITDDIDFSKLYNKLAEEDIWPKQTIIEPNMHTKLLINIKQLNKFENIIENSFKNPSIVYNKVTRISMIGYGITNTVEILNNINKIIIEKELKVLFIETSQNKISIIFNEVLSNDILSIFHKELI